MTDLATPKREKYIVAFFLLLYIVTELVWNRMSPATWDDDCPTRYYNTLHAFHDPAQFVSLWNRPLFVLLFCLPALAGPFAVSLLMTLFSALAAWLLYRAVEKSGTRFAWLVVPMLLFQPFFFGVSRNAETEPLAVLLICVGYYAYAHKRFSLFAIAGGLLPLARLELAALLPVWGWVLAEQKKLKLLLWLAVPTLLWSIAGGLITEGSLKLFWLKDQTFGQEGTENRYGHTSFGHYFRRYVFVTGPVVLFYFAVGLFESLFRRKANVFTHLQFALGFLLYVVLSWKLNMGNAAGFLRNLVPLSPMAAVIAVQGVGFFVREKDEAQPSMLEKYRVYLGPAIALVFVFAFSSYRLAFHHTLTTDKEYVNVAVIGGCLLIALLPLLVKQLAALDKFGGAAALLVPVTIVFTLVTEKPSVNMNAEREVMGRVSPLFSKGAFKDSKTFVNHIWFFWSGGMDRNDPRFQTLTLKNIQAAPKNSVIVWEKHYSQRLAGDVPLARLQNDSNFVELYHEQAQDKTFNVYLFLKTGGDASLAMPYFDKLLAEEVDKQIVLADRAMLTYKSGGNPAKALADLDNAVKSYPARSEVFFTRGVIYFGQQNMPKALDDFKQASVLDTTSVSAYSNLAVCYGYAGQLKEALGAYNHVLRLDTLYIDAYLDRSMLQLDMKDTAAAIADWMRVTQLAPDDVRAYIGLANHYYTHGDYTQAINNYSQIIRLQPNYPGAYLQRGISLVQLKHMKEAIADFDVVVKLQPNNGDAYYYRGVAEMSQMMVGEGFRDYKMAENLHFPLPDNVKQMLAQMKGLH